MSEPIVEPAAQPAAPVAPVAPTPTATPEDNTAKLTAKWVDLVTQPAEDLTKPKKADPKPEPKPEPVAPAKAEKQIKVRKAVTPEPKPEARPPVPTREEPKPAAIVPAAAPTPAVPVEDDASFEKKLFDEEKALLEDARDAEKLLGKKYEGQAKKTLEFLKESAKKEKELEAQVKSGDITEAEAKATYQEWYSNAQPKISPLDVRTIERTRAKQEALKEVEPKIAEERHARWVEAEAPKIEAKGVEIKRQLWNDALPKEVTDAANERLQGVTDETERQKIIAEVKQDFALELEVTEAITAAARDDIQEFHRLMAINPATQQPLKRRNLDLNTEEGQQHARIAAMAHGICDDFKTTGGAELKRDGKWFATWKEWHAMSPEQQSAWWTFTNDELIGRAQKRVPAVVTATIKQRHEQFESRGFKRVIPTRTKAVETPPVAPRSTSPAAPRVAPPPAAGGDLPLTQAERIARSLGGLTG